MLTNTDFDLGLKIRFVKCYVWTVLLYGTAGWTLKHYEQAGSIQDVGL